MAGESVIGALRVVLGADTAALDKGLKDSGGKLQVFADVAKASMAVAAAGVAAAAVAIGVAIKGAIDNADKVNKISQATGTTTEEFTKLRYAAELADVSQEALGKSLTKLSKGMVDAAAGGVGPAAQAFTALGISVKNNDGTLKSSNDVLADVAGKFEGYRDGAAKTALAVALFGKAGADMIPLLNAGKDGLQEAGEEAEKYGLVLDKKTTAAAEAFNDNLTKMEKIKEGLVLTITAKLLPSFEQLSETLLDAKENSTLMNGAADILAVGLKGLVTVALTGIVTVQRLGAELSALWNLAKSFGSGPFSDEWANALEKFNATEKDTDIALKELSTTVSNLWSSVPQFNWQGQSDDIRAMNKEVQAVAEQWGKVAAPIMATGDATKNALQAFLDSQAKRAAAMTADAAAVGKSTAEQAKMRLEAEAWAIVATKHITITHGVTKSILDAGNAAAAAALQLQGMQLIDQTTTPWDQRAEKVAQYTAAMTAAGASAQQLATMNMQVQFPNFTSASNSALDFGANLDKLATSSVTQLSSTLTDVIMGTKSAGEAFAAFAKQVIAQVIQMVIQLLIFKALKTALGVPFAEGGAVGIPFASGGAANFAPGGRVRGAGTGTSDSIPAMLSNGEFVINAAAARQIGMPMLNALNSGNMPTFGGGDVSDMPQTPSTGRSIQIAGIDPKKWYSGEGVRDLIDALVGAQRDGYSLSPA